MEKTSKHFQAPSRLNTTKFKAKQLLRGKLAKGQTYWLNLPFKKLVNAMFLVNLAVIFFILILQRTLPPQVPLFYGLPEGEGQLASSLLLILPSIVSIAILSINITLSLLTKEDFIKKILIASCLPITFFSIITTVKIFFLVGSL